MKYISEETEKEKQANLNKKIQNYEALQQTLKENEENKRIQAINRENEKFDDIRSIEEYTKVLEKQENERKLYFQNIENKASNFLAKMSQTVLKDIENKNKIENEKMQKYLQEKEEKLVMKEKEKFSKIQNGKKDLKAYLDMQVEEKKKEREFQQLLNKEQARIWNTDKDSFKYQTELISEKIRTMNRFNQDILKTQIDLKKTMNSTGMSDQEYLLNRNLIENASKVLN